MLTIAMQPTKPLETTLPLCDQLMGSQRNTMLIRIWLIEVAPPAKKRKTAPAPKENEDSEAEGDESADADEALPEIKSKASDAALQEKDAPEVSDDEE